MKTAEWEQCWVFQLNDINVLFRDSLGDQTKTFVLTVTMYNGICIFSLRELIKNHCHIILQSLYMVLLTHVNRDHLQRTAGLLSYVYGFNIY